VLIGYDRLIYYNQCGEAGKGEGNSRCSSEVASKKIRGWGYVPIVPFGDNTIHSVENGANTTTDQCHGDEATKRNEEHGYVVDDVQHENGEESHMEQPSNPIVNEAMHATATTKNIQMK